MLSGQQGAACALAYKNYDTKNCLQHRRGLVLYALRVGSSLSPYTGLYSFHGMVLLQLIL